MTTYDYDLAIIGGGSGGLTAAKVARFFAERVAMIDKERLGGDCLYYGCVPSKALIKAARIAHEAATAERWGLRLSGPDVTLKAAERPSSTRSTRSASLTRSSRCRPSASMYCWVVPRSSTSTPCASAMTESARSTS
ncbi:MAG: FAD-dependent oxidoreductase [Egibacteraceae bacterium]